jgi:hypothetical protein
MRRKDLRNLGRLAVVLRRPRPSIDRGLTGSSPTSIVDRYAQSRNPMKMQFDPISWMCPNTAVASLLSDEQGNDVDLPW